MNKVVFAFGRFQPPTIGHALLVEKTQSIASDIGADHVIYVSKTCDSKKNPLTIEQKMKYLSLMFPYTNFAACNNEIRTFVETAKYLNNRYDELIMVAGSDRVAVFDKILQDCNGKDFNYRSIRVVSSGIRDDDENSASGMSGTKMRALAMANEFDKFYRGLPCTISIEDAMNLMYDIRLSSLLPARKKRNAIKTVDRCNL